MTEFIDKVQAIAGLIGPNVYLQALVIAVAFIVVGKIADWLLSGAIGRLVNRSRTKLDDQLVRLLHRPIFLSFVLLGLGLATKRIALPDAPEFITLGALKTIAVIVWYNLLRHLTTLFVQMARRSQKSTFVQTGMLSLL